MKQPEI